MDSLAVPQPFTDKLFSSVAHLLTSHLRGLESPLLTQVNLNEIVASKIKHKRYINLQEQTQEWEKTKKPQKRRFNLKSLYLLGLKLDPPSY